MCRIIALLSRYNTRSFSASTCLPRAVSAASLLPSASNLSTRPMPSQYVAQPPSDSSATTTLLRHALACMVIDALALRSHTAARDVFLDLLLPAPHLAVVREADQGEVHLIETHLAFAFGVEDAADVALQHEIGSALFAHGVARLLARVDVLIAALLAYLQTPSARGHELHLAGVDERALHVVDEGLHVDVLVTEIADTADDHRRIATALLREIGEPCARHHIVDHLF